MEQGFPEIAATYKLFGAEDNFEAMRQTAGHNYNLKSREAVYNFFNKHLKLGHEGTITEAKFTPVEPKGLSVWDDEHQRSKEAVDAAGLKKAWLRLHRVIEGGETACVLLGSEPMARSAGGVTMQLGMGTARVVRSRTWEIEQDVRVSLSAAAC